MTEKNWGIDLENMHKSIENTLMKLDKIIMKQVDSKIWECHDIKTKKIRFNSDIVSCQRRYYINRITGERIFHLDNILGLNNGIILNEGTFMDNLKSFIEDRSYKNFGVNFNNIINSSSLARMIKKLNLSFEIGVTSKKR